MPKKSGDKKNIATTEADKHELDAMADMGVNMPVDTLVVNPYGTETNGKRFPEDQRYEREEQIRFPWLSQGQFVRVRMVGAAKYFSSDHSKVVYQTSVWKQNPYRAAAEELQAQTGQLIDRRRMAGMGVDHDKEMAKSRWQVAWGYNVDKIAPGAGILNTTDLQLALDKTKEFIGQKGQSNQLMFEVTHTVQQELLTWVRAPAQFKAPIPPWVLESDKIISAPAPGVMDTIKNFMKGK